MPLPADDLAVIRSWVGPGPTDEELEASYVRLGSYDLVIQEQLRIQLQVAVGQPASLTVPGLSISWGQRFNDLMNYYQLFMSTGSGLDEESSMGTVVITHLYRKDYR